MQPELCRVGPSQPSAVSCGSGQGRHVYLASLARHLGNHKDSRVVRERAKVAGTVNSFCPLTLFRPGQVSSEPASDDHEVI